METGGMVRCAECGYKNSPVYHYCGVCGAVLHAAPAEPADKTPAAAGVKAAAPEAPPATAVAPPVPPAGPPIPPPSPFRPEPAARSAASAPDSSVAGMSFLGLSQPSSSSSGTSYLLEEEEPGKRTWGRFVVIVLVLAAVGGLAWQWRHGGYPFVKTPETATTAPAQPVPTQSPVPAAENAQPAASSPAPADSPSIQPITPEPAPAQPATTEPAKPAAPETTAKTETPAETKPPAPEPKPKAPERVAAKTQPVTKPVAPPEPVVSPGESLYMQGQKYLYGTGVAANCDLAQKSLLAAAARSNTKAQSTLGTMYFTGHCVNRDLPSAYRWFAKALRQDPTNTRLEQNLNVVWRQMTADERQAAMRTQ